jgi:hypothetical protein
MRSKVKGCGKAASKEAAEAVPAGMSKNVSDIL